MPVVNVPQIIDENIPQFYWQPPTRVHNAVLHDGKQLSSRSAFVGLAPRLQKLQRTVRSYNGFGERVVALTDLFLSYPAKVVLTLIFV